MGIEDDDAGHRWNAESEAAALAVASLARELRAEAVAISGCQARQLRAVTAFVAETTRRAAADAQGWPDVVPFDASEVERLAVTEVAVALGISVWHAEQVVDRGQHLAQVAPGVLDALESGRLDWSRAAFFADATSCVDDDQARHVTAAMLAGLDADDEARVLRSARDRAAAGADHPGPEPAPPLRSYPWDSVKPATWRNRVRRAVLRQDAGAFTATPEQIEAKTRMWVRVDQNDPTRATLSVDASVVDVTWLDGVLADLAARQPTTAADGTWRSLGRRKALALFDVFKAMSCGGSLPPLAGAAVRRELGVVLHVDTLLGAGPAARDPGQLRGHGDPIPINADTAREQAQRMLARSTPTSLLLTDDSGALQRLLRIGTAPADGWTLQSLHDAGRLALAGALEFDGVLEPAAGGAAGRIAGGLVAGGLVAGGLVAGGLVADGLVAGGRVAGGASGRVVDARAPTAAMATRSGPDIPPAALRPATVRHWAATWTTTSPGRGVRRRSATSRPGTGGATGGRPWASGARGFTQTAPSRGARLPGACGPTGPSRCPVTRRVRATTAHPERPRRAEGDPDDDLRQQSAQLWWPLALSPAATCGRRPAGRSAPCRRASPSRRRCRSRLASSLASSLSSLSPQQGPRR